MAEILRVVSGPTASRTTVIDLLSSVNVLSNFSAPAPRLRRSSVSSFQADGSVDAATAWDDRELAITFAVQGSSEDQAAFVSQILGRTFARPCWLEFQGGTSKPVFFRTRATTLDAVEDYGPSNPGVRLITVVVPADPFAYGLPETGTTTVSNDPTATDGMRFTITGVKGDVPAPVNLSLSFSAGANRMLVASSTHGALDHVSVLSDSTQTALWAANGYVATTVAGDSTAIGSSFRRFTGSTVNTPAATVNFSLSQQTILPGDYRIFLRAKSATTGVRIAIRNTATGALLDSGRELPTTGWQWIDFGVIRVPTSSRRATPWSPATTTTDTLAATALITAPSSSTVIDLDHVVFVPAPGGDEEDGRLLLGRWQRDGTPTVPQAQVDSVSESLWSPGAWDLNWSAAGGFPLVTPAATNLVVIMPWITSYDSKTVSTTVNWSYHPRYLTLRGD
ncbi:hypothetical protein [Aeromicrobium sp. HA]|uniref:hypothetical protein n=1 Tax=Aeromicrobium sp. HA TaxID=3009077 RepID=UPI0022AF62E0|nr:hypothetical protein [Aeromicrobium sp. HA]